MNIIKISIAALFALVAVALVLAWLVNHLQHAQPIAAAKPVYKRHKGFQRHWRTAAIAPVGIAWFKHWLPWRKPRVEFANISEGQAGTGNKSYIPDAAIANRYNLVKIGSSQNNSAVSAANTDICLGICTDAPDASNLDVPVNVALLGVAQGTLLVVLGGTVAAGDMLQSNGDGTAIKLLTTTGTFYNIGRALTAGVAGDTIEFQHCFPLKVVNP